VSDLYEAISQYVATNDTVTVLGEVDAEQLRRNVRDRFGLQEELVWWWEGLSTKASSISYGSEDGLDVLISVLPTTAENLYLFATDDEAPPWVCVSGTGQALVALLRELPCFEFFVVDAMLTWIVFDTHQNQLIALNRSPPNAQGKRS